LRKRLSEEKFCLQNTCNDVNLHTDGKDISFHPLNDSPNATNLGLNYQIPTTNADNPCPSVGVYDEKPWSYDRCSSQEYGNGEGESLWKQVLAVEDFYIEGDSSICAPNQELIMPIFTDFASSYDDFFLDLWGES